MTTQYIIEAFSTAANQSIREFSLQDLKNIEIQNPVLAQRMADSFAARLNQQAYLNQTDWVGRSRLLATGLKTLYGAN